MPILLGRCLRPTERKGPRPASPRQSPILSAVGDRHRWQAKAWKNSMSGTDGIGYRATVDDIAMHAVVPCVASLVLTALAEERWIMRSMIEHCVGGRRVSYAKGETVISEGEKTGKLFVLLEGGLQVVKNDTV